MIIGIDIDDTITDTYEIMTSYAQEYTIDVIKKEPLINENINCLNHFYTRELHSWEESEYLKFLDKYYGKIITNVRPRTLALKYLKKLVKDGHKIVLITARGETENFDVTRVNKLTKKWIKKNNIPYDKLIINAENKLDIAINEKIDIFVDDSFKNCKIIADSGIKTFIMDTRVNRGLEDKKIKRVYSWPHLYMKIKELNI